MKFLFALALSLQLLSPTHTEPVKMLHAVPDQDIKGFVVVVGIVPHPDNIWICQVLDNGKGWEPRYCGFINNPETTGVMQFEWPNMQEGTYTATAFIQRSDKDDVITKYDSDELKIVVGKQAH